MGKASQHDVEVLLQEPYWVIDLLPAQVPAGGGGQFFAVEQALLGGQHGFGLRRAFARTLLMLNCYHDFLVFRGEREQGKANPRPERLEQWVMRNREGLGILLPSERALITVTSDSTCMTLYHPSPSLLDEVRLIAQANGLFVWMPRQGDEGTQELPA